MKILEMIGFSVSEQISPIEKEIQDKDYEIERLKLEIERLENQVESYKSYVETVKHDREYWFNAFKNECHKRVTMEIENEKKYERKERTVIIRR